MSTENENVSSEKKVDLASPPIIFRAGWKAMPPKYEVPLQLPVSKVVYISTKTKECHTEQECENIVGEIQRLHMVVKGYPDIQYNFLVGGDNRVYEGRGWHVQPSKEPTLKHLEGQTIDIAFIGDFDEINPTKSMALAGFSMVHNGNASKYVTDEVEFIPIRHEKECRTFKINLLDKKDDVTSTEN